MIYTLIAVLLFPIAWRVAFVRMWDKEDAMTRNETALIAGAVSLGIAICWPFALFALPVYFWVARPTGGEKREVLAEKERELRREAERLGLPYDV